MTEYCGHGVIQRNRLGTYRTAAGVDVCRGCNRPLQVLGTAAIGRSAPASSTRLSTAQRVSATDAAKVVVAGGFGLVKLTAMLFGLVVIGIAIWGYSRAHSPAFKMECAAYQAHEVSMSFPDNLLCMTYWQLK
jgi:hypothetical protein